jgi:hypothetical protein
MSANNLALARIVARVTVAATRYQSPSSYSFAAGFSLAPFDDLRAAQMSYAR